MPGSAAGVGTRRRDPDAHIAHILGPGGLFDDAGARSSYASAYHGRLPEAGLSALQPDSDIMASIMAERSQTHQRVIAHERQEGGPAESTYRALQPRDDQIAGSLKSTFKRRDRSREEQEQRWHACHQRKHRVDGAISEASVSDSTAQSTVPAGLRMAKSLNHAYDRGVRVPLFGEDAPKPVWTTLAAAPWVAARHGSVPMSSRTPRTPSSRGVTPRGWQEDAGRWGAPLADVREGAPLSSARGGGAGGGGGGSAFPEFRRAPLAPPRGATPQTPLDGRRMCAPLVASQGPAWSGTPSELSVL